MLEGINEVQDCEVATVIRSLQVICASMSLAILIRYLAARLMMSLSSHPGQGQGRSRCPYEASSEMVAWLSAHAILAWFQ